MGRAYFEVSADRLLDNIRRNYNRIPDPPSVNDLLNYWNAASKYTVADKILLAGVPQPVVARDKLMNVPVQGFYNWDPGAFFGIYRPETFWFK